MGIYVEANHDKTRGPMLMSAYVEVEREQEERLDAGECSSAGLFPLLASTYMEVNHEQERPAANGIPVSWTLGCAVSPKLPTPSQA